VAPLLGLLLLRLLLVVLLLPQQQQARIRAVTRPSSRVLVAVAAASL
jgi:hypothetical protein